MIKKLIYILLFLPLFVSGQNNFFGSHIRSFEPEIIVTTKNPTDITSSSALLGGNILSANVNVVKYGFTVNEDRYPEYGEFHTWYNTDFEEWEEPPLSLPYSFSYKIINFNSGTTYYIRAWVYDGTTVFYGEEKTFTTDN